MIIFGVLLRCVIFAKWIGAENNYQKADQKVIKDLNDSSGSQFASPKSVGVRRWSLDQSLNLELLLKLLAQKGGVGDDLAQLLQSHRVVGVGDVEF